MFTHVVLFYLKDRSDSAKQKVIGDCLELLAKIPGVKMIDAGVPAMTPRAVVDNSYDVGLVTVFADKAGHDTYQSHDLHQKFLTLNRENLEQVKIFDFHAGA